MMPRPTTRSLNQRTSGAQIDQLLGLLGRASVIPSGEHPEDRRMLVIQENELIRVLKKANLKVRLRTGEIVPPL